LAVSFGNSWFFFRATNLFDANIFPTAPSEPYVGLGEASDDVGSGMTGVEYPVPGKNSGCIFIDVTDEVVPLCDGCELLSDSQ
jgi:hypothetical protein